MRRQRNYPFDYACVSCFEETCVGCGVLSPELEEDTEEEPTTAKGATYDS